MTRLFFVEGVSGVGKTTTVEALCRELGNLSIPAQCYVEGDPSNPVDLFGCAYLTAEEFAGLLGQYPHEACRILRHSVIAGGYALVRYREVIAGNFIPRLFGPALHDWLREREGFYKPMRPMPIDSYTKVFADCWQRYLASREASEARGPGEPGEPTADIAIFDGCFLYHRINDLTHNYGADDDQIVAHLNALLTAMLPHKPYLFYLSAPDVGERLRSARKARGQDPPTAERIATEVERKRRQLAVLERIPIERQVFDISNGWDSAMSTMLSIVESRRQRCQQSH